MFICEIKQSNESKRLIEKLKNSIPIVPIHFELLASLNPKKFKMFMQDLAYIQSLEDIKKDFFVFIRLYIASKENFIYCEIFNTKLLQNLNYTKEQIKKVQVNISNIPLDNKHKSLAIASIKAIYDYENFTKEDIKTLHELGWNDEYIYTAIDHAALLFKNARIIRGYLK